MKKRRRRRSGGKSRKYISSVIAVLLIVTLGIGLTVSLAGRKGHGPETDIRQEAEPLRAESTEKLSENEASQPENEPSWPEISQEKKDGAVSEEKNDAQPVSKGDEAEETKEQSPEDEPVTTAESRTSVSVMGDSISTFSGYIPQEYYIFFPDNGAVADVNDTWWKQAVDGLNLELYVNGSSSGATCIGDSTGTTDPQCGCNEFRTNGLYGPCGEIPDIILLYMGTNDALKSIPLGDNDGTRKVEEGMISTFSDAYTLMLDKLQNKYKGAQIYCFTLLQVGTWGTDTPFVTYVNEQGLTSVDYNVCIKRIAENKGCRVIDLENCGVAVDNLHNTTSDGVHPTPEGMGYIAEAVIEALQK